VSERRGSGDLDHMVFPFSLPQIFVLIDSGRAKSQASNDTRALHFFVLVKDMDEDIRGAWHTQSEIKSHQSLFCDTDLICP
jgi:hypothetical protein